MKIRIAGTVGESIVDGPGFRYTIFTQGCSIISATYHLDGKPIATLAVLGPTRMDYGKIISLLKFMNANLADIFHRFHLYFFGSHGLSGTG